MASSATNVVIVGAGASARMLTKFLNAESKKTNKQIHITIIQPCKFASMPYYQTMVLTKKDTFESNSTFCEIEGSHKTVYGVAVACVDGILSVQPLNKDGSKDDSAETLQVPFDVLVAATGLYFPILTEVPGQSISQRQGEIDRVSKLLLSGKNVVIAGGGATGVELAADVAEEKGKVTLICSSDRLLADQPPYYGERCKQVLEEMGATVVFNERVKSHSESVLPADDNTKITLELTSGKQFDCHAYVAAYARGINTKWLTTEPPNKGNEGGLPDKLLNEKGQVVVNEYLQSTVYDKLFSLGAANSWKGGSLTANIEKEATVVAANICKPKSKQAVPGMEHASYQVVGHDTFGTVVPESLPLPACCATLCCGWCGFPCNLLCPCFCMAVVCGPVDPMTCGWCCGRPEGAGLTKTLKKGKDMNLMANMAGFKDVGAVPAGENMER